MFPKLLWISQIPTGDGYINAGAATFLEFSLHNATNLDNKQFCWCAHVQFRKLVINTLRTVQLMYRLSETV